MGRRTQYVTITLPTDYLLEEFSMHKSLLEIGQVDLKTIAACVMGNWAQYESNHWQYYNPANLSTCELLLVTICQDVLVGAPIKLASDHRDLVIVVSSFVKRFYYEIILTLENFNLTDIQLRQLEVMPWQHQDMTISIPIT